MSQVPFAPKPYNDLAKVATEYPKVAAYIAYLEDLDRVTSERARIAERRLKQKSCPHYMVHNGRCVECGKEGVY